MEISPSSNRELLARVQSWSRVPRLRRDLRVVRVEGSPEYRLCDPESGRFVELYDLEYAVARELDGERSSDELTALARALDPAIDRAQIEALVAQLFRIGALEADPAAPEASGTQGAGARGALASAPARNGAADELARLRGELAEELARGDEIRWVSGAGGAGRPPLLASGEADRGARQTADDTAQRPPEAPGPETPELVASEQEALWKQAHVATRRWYQRTGVRLAIACVVLLGGAGWIEYPLYITSECTIIPSQRAYVRSRIDGVLADILVDEGAAIRAGDVIARLDDRQLRADRKKALAETDRISAELARLRHGARAEEIAQQRAVALARRRALEFAEREAARRARMAEEGVGSRQAHEEAELDRQLKQDAASEAGAALRLIEAGSRPEEIAALEAELRRATAELEHIDLTLRDMIVIRAPIDGIVLTPRFRERVSERVEAGGLVCEIAGTRRMRAEIFVAEREADTIGVGMPVVVKVESHPLRPFHGSVELIAPAVEVREQRNVLRVVATLDNPQGLLRQDMTGYGEVECGRRSLLELATRRLLRWIRVRFLI